MKYLVIQTHDIGDVMLSTALCNTLKRSHPDAKVDMMTMDHCAGVVEGNPNIDEILVLVKSKRNSLRYVFNFLQNIRSKKYDVILNVQGQIIGLVTCLFSRSSRRIGFDKFPWRLAHTDHVEFPCPHEPSGEGRTIDDRFTLLDPLSINVQSRSYKLWLSDEERQTGYNIFTSAGVDMAKPVVALGINSRDDYKQWPINYFAHLTEWLIDNYNTQIYVFFGPGEEEYSQRLKKLLPEEKQPLVFDDVRSRNIRELAMLFSHCKIYVGNDTGPRHIAQALNIPAFAIVSPFSDKRGWIPWNSSRFKAVDSGDAAGLSESEWIKIRKKLTLGIDDAGWFLKLDNEFVQSQLAEMIDELNLFANPEED